MKKALFLDLDHTLIRPKIAYTQKVPVSDTCSDAEEAEAWATCEKMLPKHIQEIVPCNKFSGLDKYVQYSYRPIFPTDCNDWEFLPGMPHAIREYVAEGFEVILITNQGGIEAGHHSSAEVCAKIHAVLLAAAFIVGPMQSTFYLCPTNNKEDYNRKPNPGLLFQAQKHRGIDLVASLFVGDMESDRECARRAGVSYMDIKEFLRTHA